MVALPIEVAGVWKSYFSCLCRTGRLNTSLWFTFITDILGSFLTLLLNVELKVRFLAVVADLVAYFWETGVFFL